MIEIEITPEMITRAKAKSKEMGALKKSITKGEGNLVGFIGEEVANVIIEGEISNTYNYDIVKDNIKYDVKTKRCTSKPRTNYECSIADYNTKQGCNRYAFVRIEEFEGPKWGRAWLLGWMDKKEYFKKAKKLLKGQIDPSNNFTVKADCWNLAISELCEFEEPEVDEEDWT